MNLGSGKFLSETCFTLFCFTQVPDYLEVIKEPMDLATILHRIDCHYYSTCMQYLNDIDLISSNALKYNPDRDPLDKLIRHRACELADLAHSHIKSQLEPEFEKVSHHKQTFPLRFWMLPSRVRKTLKGKANGSNGSFIGCQYRNETKICF